MLTSEDIAGKLSEGVLNKYFENGDQYYASKDKSSEYQLIDELDENKLKEELCEANYFVNNNTNIFFEEKTDYLKSNICLYELGGICCQNFCINGLYYNIIDDIILEFYFNEYENNYHDLLTTNIKFSIGGNNINGTMIKMEYNILLCELMGKKMVIENNTVKINSCHFEQLKNNFQKNNKIYQCNGFPLFVAMFHNLSIDIFSNIPNIGMIIKHRKINNQNYIEEMQGKDYEFPIIGIREINDINIINSISQNLCINLIGKFMIIKLKCEDDSLINLHQINLFLNKLSPIEYNIYLDEIKELNMFENRYFIISMSPLFKNIKDLSNNLKNGNIGKYGINFSRMDNINIEINDIKDNIKIDICFFYLNIVTLKSGMIGGKFFY